MRAASPTLDHLIGRWCGDTSQYVFKKTELDVTLLSGQKPKHGPVPKISQGRDQG
jgi:hypothetical protein